MHELQIELARRDFVIDVDLRLAPGEVYGLFGPSAAGKSSLLRAIAGFEPTTRRRRVAFDGQPLSPAAPPWRSGIGWVAQTPLLFAHLTVMENVCYGARHGRADALARQLAHDFDLDRLLAERPRRLSGGWRQTVALARALAARPTLLLLDEPLSAMDEGMRVPIGAKLQHWLRQLSVTSIVVSHQLTELQRWSDRIGVIDRGRILQQETAAQLVARPLSATVARLVGYTAFLRQDNGDVLGLHPERVRLGESGEPGLVFRGVVAQVTPHGGGWQIAVDVQQQRLTLRTGSGAAPAPGDAVAVTAVDPPRWRDES